MTKKPISRQSEILVQDLENELLVYDLQSNKAFCLNQASALVFQLSDGTRTALEIGEVMSEKLAAPVGEDFVWLALDGLKKENLLGNGEQLTDEFEGLSRREIVKRVGFASMAALPIIASVVAPIAASAQSANLLAIFSPCSSPNQCQSGNCETSLWDLGAFHCCAVGYGGVMPGTNIGVKASGPYCLDNCNPYANACCSGDPIRGASAIGICPNELRICGC